MKAAALSYAALKIPVFPCGNNKNPLTAADLDENGDAIVGTGGFYKATCDVAQIEAWWTKWPNAMIGYPTGVMSGIDVLDLDFDPGKGKNGFVEVPDWQSRSSVIVRTPRGGAHLLYRTEGKINCSTDEIAHGVDTRGRGGYAILPPSKNGDGHYRFEKGNECGLVALEPFPLDLAARLIPRGELRVANGNPVGDIDLVRLAMLVIPNENLSWEEWNKIGLATWAATEGTGTEIFDAWSQKSTKYNFKETQRRWNHYFKSPPDSIGVNTLFWLANQVSSNWDADYYKSEDFNDAETSASQVAWLKENVWGKNAPVKKQNGGRKKKVPPEDDLGRMNDKYAVVLDGGKVNVLMFEKNIELVGRYRHERNVPMFLSFEDFRNLHLNKVIWIKDKKKKQSEENVAVPLGHWWLKHPDRRQYDGLVFEPSGENVIGGRLNLWRGWGIEPKAGNWSLMQQHIKQALASSNQEIYDYIIKWLAWGVQNPNRRAEVALVFKGPRGSGKGTLGNAMCRMFGQHGVHISNANHLTGFNAHLRDACFLFADEAYWPGDKSAEGDLKRLITEPELFIRAMRRDGVMVDNMLHVMMASNEDWIIPAGEHERRFAVFLVNDVYLQNDEWFSPLYKQLDDGGYAAMLHDLLAMKLGPWHPRNIPASGKNGELLNQQSRSLDPFDAWWVELLETGTLEGSDPGKPNFAVSNEYLKDGFIRQKGLYDQARLIEPRLKSRNDHLLGHFLTSKGCSNKKRVLRRRGWEFKKLQILRSEWERRYPGWPWRHPEIDDWQTELGPEIEEDKNNQKM